MFGVTTLERAEAARREIAKQCIDKTLPHLAELIAGKKAFAIESAVLAEAGMTVRQFARDLWLKSPTRTKLAACGDNESALRVHVLETPVEYRSASVPFGDIPLSHVVSEHLVELVYALDQRVLERKGAARPFSEKRAINVWAVVTRMFQDAHSSKDPTVKVLRMNPCVGVRGPDRGAEKSKVYIFPTEFLRLVGSPLVPVEWRQFYALGVYAYMRVSEMRCIEATDIDLEHQRIHIHKRMDRAGKVRHLKGKAARVIPMEPHSVPIWRALIRRTTGRLFSHLVAMDSGKKLASTLRAHMVLAGITRKDLFVSDETRRQMRCHDLRATGITWMAVRGDSALLIMHRSAHKDYEVMLQYVREAENLRDANFGQVFPELPVELGIPADEAPEPPPNPRANGAAADQVGAVPSGFLHRGPDATVPARVSAGGPNPTTFLGPNSAAGAPNSSNSREIGDLDQIRFPAPPPNSSAKQDYFSPDRDPTVTRSVSDVSDVTRPASPDELGMRSKSRTASLLTSGDRCA
jgi:integrase